MPVERAQDPAAMVRAHVATVVTAASELEDARKQLAAAATAVADLLDRIDSPIWGRTDLSGEAVDDIVRRARGIASDVDGESIVALDEVQRTVIREAVELQDVVEFFLSRATQEAVA
jgi:hypothetical protein